MLRSQRETAKAPRTPRAPRIMRFGAPILASSAALAPWRSIYRHSHWVLLACALLAACARPRGARPPRPIDDVRERAAEHPNDPQAWLELALAEHLFDGADAGRAREALTRAKQLGAKSLRLTFVEAEQHVLEARPARALDAYLALLAAAPDSSDPLAPSLAEAAFAALSDMNDAVDDYRGRLREATRTLAPKRAHLGLTSAHQLALHELGQALLDGDLARAKEVAQLAGCVQRAQVAGPFGPRELLGFERELPAQKPGPLAKEYDLGPGRGVQPVRNIETRRCVLPLGRGAHDPLPGTSVVRAELEVRETGAHALRIESPNSFVLWVDGRELLRVDLRTQHPFGVRYVPVELTAGKHELKLKLSSRHPSPALSLALVRADQAAVERTRLPAPDDLISRYLAARLALTRGDAVSARELTRGADLHEPSAHWLVLEAAAAIADPLRAKEQRRDRARELLRRAEKADPAAWYPTVGLANLEAAEGRTKEAIEALRAAALRFPEAIAIKTALSEHLRQRGYNEESDRIVEELQKRLPKACAVLGLSLQSAKSRGRMADVERLIDPLLACDAGASARYALFKAQRKYAEAAAELLRLRALADPPDPGQLLESELEHARLSGNLAREHELREQRSALWFDRPEPVLDKVDLALTRGDRKAALAYLTRAIAESPDTLFELTRIEEALGGAELFKDFRKDGARIIEAFEASGRGYTEPEVLLLDYTVVRVFPDGSSADLTHNILRMQSQEAVDRNGEFAVPDGARLLALHTVKSDGQRLEPDPIPEKTTWSLPNLALGDYVEFEMVRGETPSLGFPGGYLGNRFYFKSLEVPFDHTELVVVLPAGVEPVLDPRGPAPKTVRETKDGLTVLRWAEDESRPLTEEPGSVATREYVPSINLGFKTSWEQYVESLRDLLADKDIHDPQAEAMVKQLLGKDAAAPASVRANKLYRFVSDQIEPSQDVFGLAPAMLAARTGSRERVLRYMLALAGVESELALVRGIEADHSQAILPDPETFGYLVLRVKTERGPVWLHAGARHAPFGFLPPQIRGEQALVLNAATEHATTPKAELDSDRRETDVQIELERDGKSEITVRETHRGPSAVAWRNDLDEVPQAELSARFEESYATNVIAGARLKRVSFEQRDNPEAPLVIQYELDVDNLGHRVGDELRIPGLFPSTLQGQFARLAQRTTSALVAPAQVNDVRISVQLPRGVKVRGLPKPARLEHAGARFTLETASKEDQVEITRRVRVPVQRVTPTDYPAFASFCRSVDLAEAAELTIALP
jgi:cellulose synthase operon protein C